MATAVNWNGSRAKIVFAALLQTQLSAHPITYGGHLYASIIHVICTVFVEQTQAVRNLADNFGTTNPTAPSHSWGRGGG